MNVFGSPNICTVGHICHYPRVLGGVSTYGVMRLAPDYENSKCIVLWGANPPGTAEGGLRVGQIFNAKEKGAKLIVVDPLLTAMAAKADLWLQLRPGTDCALALAMINVIINEELYDKEFVDKWVEGFDKLKEHVQQYTPESVEKITNVKADLIREAARLYATIKPACLYDGNAVDHQINSVQTTRALAILRALTGNIDIPGGDLIPTMIPTVDIRLMDRLPKDVKPVGDYPLMFQYRHLPAPAVIDAILTEKPYPIKAMIVQGGNLAVVLANVTKTREALQRLDLLVVMDLFMTRTAELADIVLPAATSFEKTGLTAYPAARTPFVLLEQKVIEPIGEAWPDWKFWFELGRKLGYKEEFVWEDVEEAIDEQIKPSGLTVDQLKKGPVFLPVTYKKYEEKGFNTPSKKVEFYSKLLEKYGYNPLPTYVEPPETPISKPDLAKRYPLMGVCWPRDVYVHTQHRNIPWLRMFEPEPSVRINPKDAEKRGIKDGDLVEASSPRGSIKVKAIITERVPEGLVAFVWGWGETDPEADLNRLTNDADRDPIAGSTSNKLFLCEIRKV
ncbi:formate dehydrogenase [Candidatus Bathyarchaeota archaeon]|nr:MAG: formate dehydrogenase [Candidatus Bathyarchaeota archaeon]